MRTEIQILRGDITMQKVDAIVNAANSTLMGGGGVDGAIHRAGGPRILEECKAIVAKQGNCKTGESVITTAGHLSAKFVIHTVGPFWTGGTKNESKLLVKAYNNTLALAQQYEILSIAIPNISTGTYGFPKDQAAEIAWETVNNFIASENKLEQILFVCFDEENFNLYTELHNSNHK